MYRGERYITQTEERGGGEMYKIVHEAVILELSL